MRKEDQCNQEKVVGSEEAEHSSLYKYIKKEGLSKYGKNLEITRK
jgi:hypothetical protein